MLARPQGPAVEPTVLLHVGERHEQIELRPGKHLVDVRIRIRDVIPRGLAHRPLVDDVARADQFHVRRLGQVREVLVGDASTPDDANANFLLLSDGEPLN